MKTPISSHSFLAKATAKQEMSDKPYIDLVLLFTLIISMSKLPKQATNKSIPTQYF